MQTIVRVKRSPHTALVAVVVFVFGHCGVLFAAPPDVKHLFPPGGQRGGTVEVTATGSFSSWPVKAWASDAGVQVACGQDKGKLQVAVEPGTRPGVYLIRLYDDEGASRPLPFVVGNLPEVVERAENDSPDKAQQLPSSAVTVNGRLEKRDDVDVYAVELEAGQTMVASVVANQTLASPMDAVLQILTAEGVVLAQNHDWHGLDPQIVYTARSAGKYLVRIFAFPAQPDSRIGLAGGEEYLYRLTVTTGPFVDFAWPLAVQEQVPTEVELVGWNLDDAIKRQKVTATEHPFVLDGDHLAGQFSLSVEPHRCIAETEPNGKTEPPSIELPVTISGKLEAAGDTDVFRFNARRGDTVLFKLQGRQLGSPLDAVLQVTDSSGKSLARADDMGQDRDPELTWKVPQDGAYQVEVADLHGHGDERFFYRLRAAVASPDFAIKSPEHSHVAQVGKPLEINLEIDRRHGFDQEISFQIEGLPQTIVAEPAISAAAGDTAKKVGLKLTGSEGFSGSCRIVGTAKGEKPLERTAAHTLPNQAECHDVWITFRPDEKQ